MKKKIEELENNIKLLESKREESIKQLINNNLQNEKDIENDKKKMDKDKNEEIKKNEDIFNSKKIDINSLIEINEIIKNNLDKNEKNYYANINFNKIISIFDEKKNFYFKKINDNKLLNLNFSKNLIEKSYHPVVLENSFITFECNQETYIVFSDENLIKCFDLKKNQIVKEINSHSTFIFGFNHFFDEEKNNNLILSFDTDNNIKVWLFDTWNCILDLQNIYEEGKIYSACFLKVNNILYVVNSNAGGNLPITIFDLEGNEIKKIKSDKYVYYIDTFYDEIKLKNYIIVSCRGCIESYLFDEGVKHKTFLEDKSNEIHKYFCFLIFKDNEILKLIANEKNAIKILNFDNGEILEKIEIKLFYIRSLGFWDKNNIMGNLLY